MNTESPLDKVYKFEQLGDEFKYRLQPGNYYLVDRVTYDRYKTICSIGREYTTEEQTTLREKTKEMLKVLGDVYMKINYNFYYFNNIIITPTNTFLVSLNPLDKPLNITIFCHKKSIIDKYVEIQSRHDINGVTDMNRLTMSVCYNHIFSIGSELLDSIIPLVQEFTNYPNEKNNHDYIFLNFVFNLNEDDLIYTGGLNSFKISFGNDYV